MNLSTKNSVSPKGEKPAPNTASELRAGGHSTPSGRPKLASGEGSGSETSTGSRLNFRGSVRAISVLSKWDGLVLYYSCAVELFVAWGGGGGGLF